MTGGRLSRDELVAATRKLRRTWPAEQARELVALARTAPREAELVLAFVLELDAVPVVDEWPAAPVPRRARAPRPRRQRPKPMPPELAGILRRLGSDRAPDGPVPGEQVTLDVEAAP